MKFVIGILARVFTAALTTLAVGSVGAQDYPNKPIRIIDPWAPGGGSDHQIRPLAAKLSEALGQQVNVESRAGANSIIGTDYVARSAPDGYTLLMGSKTITSNATYYTNLPYDTATALTPISMVSRTPFFVVVNASLPVKNIKELIDLAKSRPGYINLASSGIAGAPHLAGQFFSMQAGIKMTHVPYKGVGPAVLDLMKGDVHVLFTGLSAVATHVKSGRLRLLAFAGQERSPAMPDVPTVSESGLPGFEAAVWYGIFGPAGLPRDITNRLATEIAKALQTKDLEERFAAIGAQRAWTTPEEFEKIFREELVRQGEVVKASGLSKQL